MRASTTSCGDNEPFKAAFACQSVKGKPFTQLARVEVATLVLLDSNYVISETLYLAVGITR